MISTQKDIGTISEEEEKSEKSEESIDVDERGEQMN